LIEIDHVHAEATEARIASGSDSIWVQSLASRVRHREAHLRRKHDFNAVTGEPWCQSADFIAGRPRSMNAAGFEESVSMRWAPQPESLRPSASCPAKSADG
jgi:hypothetical protein